MDAVLPEFPAQQYNFAVVQSRKIDETDIQILHLTSKLLDLLNCRAEFFRGRMTPAFVVCKLTSVHVGPAQRGHAPCGLPHTLFRIDEFLLQLNRSPDYAFHCRQQAFRLRQREVFLHDPYSYTPPL